MAQQLDHLRDWIGREEVKDDVVRRDFVRGLYATLDRTDRMADPLVVPRLIHWLHFHPLAPQSELGPDGHPKRGGFLPPVPLPRRMWAGSRMRFARTPARSRTAPSVTRAATPRLAMRAHRMSPKIPASVTPMASTTAMQPGGIASIAARVEIGDDQDSGVARSSRAGTKRRVNARPTVRPVAVGKGRVPRIHTLRSPFLSSTVVRVAVEMRSSARACAASRVFGSVRMSVGINGFGSETG